MKKMSRKKLTLETSTIRALLETEMLAAQGGLPRISVGTCSACRPTYDPTCVSCTCL